MGFLDLFIHSPFKEARKMVKDDEAFLAMWKRYVVTLDGKAGSLAAYRRGDQQALKRFEAMLETEMFAIERDERADEDLIREMHMFVHEEQIAHVHRLACCLNYRETEFEYLDKLLRELHACLVTQLHMARRLPQIDSHLEGPARAGACAC